jgi:hypothetical protein
MLTLIPNYRPTCHYLTRRAERTLRPEVEAFILRWGTPVQVAGAIHFTVVYRELPEEMRSSNEAARADGWIIVVAYDGSLLTCYRRRHAWRFIRRKRWRPRRHARRT